MNNTINKVFVLTRGQAKEQTLGNIEYKNDPRSYHPGVVGILKKPDDSIELRLLSVKEYKKELRNYSILRLFVEKFHIKKTRVFQLVCNFSEF